MRKLLATLVVPLFAFAALPAFAEGGCGGYQSVDTDTLITADGTTVSGPSTPVPPKTEPEG